MTYAADVLYAWMKLGVAPGADSDALRMAAAHARTYRFATRARLDGVHRLMQFFAARGRFGRDTDTFEAIRKAYYKRAMELHPDRNPGDTIAEERLKNINAAYELVEDIHKEAREHFDKSEAERTAIEKDMREQAARETSAAGAGASAQTVNMSYEEAEAPRSSPQEPPREAPPTSRAPGTVKYMAASIPRFIRASRLFYLGRNSILGSYRVQSPGSQGLVYDVIMLPEIEFNRARLRLTMEGYGVQELTMSKLTPPYIPIDTKEVIVPEDEPYPAAFARRHFMSEYGLPRS